MRPWLSTYIVYGVDDYNCERGFPATWHNTGAVKEHIVLNKPCLTCCLKACSTHTPSTVWWKYGSALGLCSTSQERGKGWMRFQRRHGNGVPPPSVACCRVHVTDVNWTTRTWWCFYFCKITKEPRSGLWPHYCPGLSLAFPVLLICTVEEKTCLL